jgi:hypothetical protein
VRLDWKAMPCPDCGAPFDGREQCHQTFHELGVRAANDIRFGYRRRALVDAYALQHPAYVQSVKSLAAHLCGLCAAMERPGDPRAEHAIWSALRVAPDAIKPPLPERRGSLTIADVCAVPAEEFPKAVDAWVVNVWDAWREHHELARKWLDYSIAAGSQRH